MNTLMTDAVVRVTTPTSARMWHTNHGQPARQLLDLGRTLRAARADGRGLDAADFLDDVRQANPDQAVREIGGAFPPRTLTGTGVGWLYDIAALDESARCLTVKVWGPDVALLTPSPIDGLDPQTVPLTDPRWSSAYDPLRTCTGHLPAESFEALAVDDEPLARHLRPAIAVHLAELRQADPVDDDELAAWTDVLADWQRPDVHAIPPGHEDATERQLDLMSAALRRYASPVVPETGRRADEAVIELIPDAAVVDEATRADIESITGRSLRGPALSTGGYGTPNAAAARAWLNRWAARWS